MFGLGFGKGNLTIKYFSFFYLFFSNGQVIQNLSKEKKKKGKIENHCYEKLFLIISPFFA